ncbi:nascent polypeptide-associated complex subunit alpha, muscle-specific form-like [Pan paniscus]|uniref:nascent polypeptide-associated complex subunit alpha, muscle-specific form-like n=1 Tax=Pan paniscus TaxID=9597 RepID=UPI001560D50E
MRALNAPLLSLPSPPGWKPAAPSPPTPGAATAPRTSDTEPGTKSPGPGSCQAGEGQRQLWTFRDSPSPQSLSLPSARRKRKSLRGRSSSPGGRPTPVGTPAAPTGEAAAPTPEEAAAAAPSRGRYSHCSAPLAAVPAVAACPLVAPTVSAAAPAAPSFPHLFKYRPRSGFSREKYFFKKKKEKENDTPSFIALITTPPPGPIHPPFPLPFASLRLGAGPLARRISAVGGGRGDQVLPGLGLFVLRWGGEKWEEVE